MKKKIFALLLTFSILFALQLPAFAASGSLSVSSSKTNPAVGDEVTLTVSMSGTDNATSMALTFQYDTNAIEIKSGEWLKTGSALANFDKANNAAAIAFTSATDLNGNLFRLVVTVKSSAAKGNTTVTVKPVVKNGGTAISCAEASTTLKVTCKTHRYGNWEKANDSQHKHTCSECGHVETANHTWNSGTVTKAATCKETGVKTYTCTTCSATKKEIIAKTNNHSFGDWKQTKAPTCTDAGTETRTCTVCGKPETRNISALGHSFSKATVTKEPTCTAAGVKTGTCTRCGKTTTESIPATGHSMSKWTQTKAPTCTEKGTETRKCSKCSHTETKDIAALGHSFSNPTVTKRPTCTEAGVETGTCTRCKQTATSAIKPTGHKFGEWSDSKAATCTEGGTQKRVCATCGAEETRNNEPLGHDFENPTIVKEPTISSTGLKEGKCRRCGETTSEVIPCSYSDTESETTIEADEGAFAEGTAVTVEKIDAKSDEFTSAKNILSDISGEFTLYNISAVLNGSSVQPNGKVKVTFTVPDGYGKDVAVYLINDDGTAQKLEASVSEDGKTVEAQTDKLNRIAVCKLGDTVDTDNEADENTDGEKQTNNTVIWIIVGAAVLVTLIGVIIFIILKKKRS